MKIAHVNFAVEASVDQKLERLAEAARESGYEMSVVNFSQHAKPGIYGNLHVYALPGRRLGKKTAPKAQWPFRLFVAARVVRSLGVDAVILRYPKLPFGGLRFLKRVGVPVITEHHTDELAEILGDGSPLRRAAAAFETFLRRRFLGRVAGYIGVTPEITRGLRKECPGVPGKMLANGIQVTTVPFEGFHAYDGGELRMIMVASEFFYWHGLERLLTGMLRYSGSASFRLILLGTVPVGYTPLLKLCGNHPSITVECPGAVYGDSLQDYFRGVHLAVASLGLYRKRMEEACPLKSREYMARGVPFVYGYSDPEIDVNAPYALKVINTPEPIDMDRIVAFAVSLSKNADVARIMRGKAERDFDLSVKIGEMFRFLEEVTG